MHAAERPSRLHGHRDSHGRARITRAEVSEVRLSKQYGLPYLPFMVMEQFPFLEKQAEKQGLTLKVSWTTLSNASAMMEAILSGQMDFIAPGVPTLATMWDKTVGTPNEIRALSAVQSMPYVLVTREARINAPRFHRQAPDRAARREVHRPRDRAADGRSQGIRPRAVRQAQSITVSLSHPDAAAALLAGKGEINAHFASSPFYYIELAAPTWWCSQRGCTTAGWTPAPPHTWLPCTRTAGST